jgi:hypothetical protein
MAIDVRNTSEEARLAYERAAGRLYSAEIALHDARQSGVDAWMRAAADRLHAAVLSYEVARQSALSEQAAA